MTQADQEGGGDRGSGPPTPGNHKRLKVSLEILVRTPGRPPREAIGGLYTVPLSVKYFDELTKASGPTLTEFSESAHAW